MQLRRILVVLAIAFPFTSALAQSKVAFVDLQRVLSEIDEGKAMKARFEGEAKKKRDELQKEGKALQADIETLQKQASAMSKEVQAQKGEELQKRQQSLIEKAQRAEMELGQAQQAALAKIIQTINPIVTKIAEREGIGMVVERAALVFAQPSLDITNEVIRTYNASGPKKSAAPAKSDAPKK